jgi:hypothetical protein
MAKFGQPLFSVSVLVKDIETAIYNTLMANAALVALVGDRIYPVIAPQDVAEPFVVYERLPTEMEYTQDGLADLQTARFRFTSSAMLYANCVSTDAAIRNALNVKGLLGESSVSACGTFFEQPDDAFSQEANLHSRTSDVDIQFK